MEEDDASGSTTPEGRSDPSGLKIFRRDILTGAVASLLPTGGSVRAEVVPPRLYLRYANDQTREILLISISGQPDQTDWRIDRADFGSEARITHWFESGHDFFSITNAALPGASSRYSLDFMFLFNVEWFIAAGIRGWPVQKRLDPLSLNKFLGGAGALQLPVSGSVASSLVAELFGQRVLAGGPAVISLKPATLRQALPGADVSSASGPFVWTVRATRAPFVALRSCASFNQISFPTSSPDSRYFEGLNVTSQRPGKSNSPSLVARGFNGDGSGIRLKPFCMDKSGEEGAHRPSFKVATEAAAKRADSVWFVQWGIPVETLAGIEIGSDKPCSCSVATISVTSRSGAVTVFQGSFLRIWRRELLAGSSNGIRTHILLTPLTTGFEVTTDHGPFEVCAQSSQSPPDGSSPEIPPVASIGIDVPNRGFPELITFDARLALVSAPIQVPEKSRSNGTRTTNSNRAWSHLDFGRTECRFLVPEIPQDPQAAATEALIVLGYPESPSFATARFPVSLSLDRARLRVVRPTDLLSLLIRFQGLVLTFDSGIGVIRPGSPQTACAVVSDRGFSREDRRPRLIVEFPPQHVMEQAFDLSADKLPNATAAARLSGPSRVAFAINCDDWEAGRQGGLIDFTLESLVDWGSFDLSVTKRAEKLYSFSDRLPPKWSRTVSTTPSDILAFQGIRPGDAVATSNDKLRLAQPDTAQSGYRLRAQDRLADIQKSISIAPTSSETAIELPARLFLSPAQDAIWLTPRKAQSLYSQDKPAPTVDELADVLWHATMDLDSMPSSLRAVWSPDFRPETLAGRGADGTFAPMPPTGPWAPWELSHGQSQPIPAATQFRTSLDAASRHELVALSSVYGLPVRGRRFPNSIELVSVTADDNRIVDGQQIDPPPGYHLADLMTYRLADDPIPRDLSAIYQPKQLDVSELSLTSLGGCINLDTHFIPPASALDSKGNALFETFSVERWRHRATLGRDISVEVVRKGFLFPLGHRASYVVLTERRVLPHPLTKRPVAYLVQRQFLRIANPEKAYPSVGQQNDGRACPFSRLRLLTRQTPDIDPPDPVASSGPPKVSSSGRWTGSDNLIFWPKFNGSDVQFQVQIDGAGDAVQMSLVFIDNAAANDPQTMKAFCDFYNNGTDEEFTTGSLDIQKGPSRVINHGGADRRYAQEDTPGSCTHSTQTWFVKSEGTSYSDGTPNSPFQVTPFMDGVDQPPFYPSVDKAIIRLRQIERFTGTNVGDVLVAYEPSFLSQNFQKANGEVYLAVISRDGKSVALDLGANGDRAGGIGRPNIVVGALSRSQGPVGGNPKPLDPAATAGTNYIDQFKTFNPASFFSSAKLFGLLDFSEVLSIAADTIFDGHAPRLIETLLYGAAAVGQTEASVRDAVTKQVLLPFQAVLQKVDSDWVKTINGQPGLGNLKLADVLTDFSQAKDALQGAIDHELDTSTTDASFLSGLANIYQTGWRLIEAVKRTASDPTAQIRDALQRATVALLGLLTGPPVPIATLAGLQAQTMRGLTKGLLQQDVATALRNVVISVPIPIIDDPALRQTLLNTIEDATKGALAGNLDAASIRKALSQALDDAGSDDLANAKTATKQLLDGATSDDIIKGPLFDQLVNDVPVVGDLSTASAAEQIDQVSSSLAAIFNRFAPLRALVQSSPNDVQASTGILRDYLLSIISTDLTDATIDAAACSQDFETVFSSSPSNNSGAPVCDRLSTLVSAVGQLSASCQAASVNVSILRQSTQKFWTNAQLFAKAADGLIGTQAALIDVVGQISQLKPIDLASTAPLPQAGLFNFFKSRTALIRLLASTVQSLSAIGDNLASLNHRLRTLPYSSSIQSAVGDYERAATQVAAVVSALVGLAGNITSLGRRIDGSVDPVRQAPATSFSNAESKLFRLAGASGVGGYQSVQMLSQIVTTYDETLGRAALWKAGTDIKVVTDAAAGTLASINSAVGSVETQFETFLAGLILSSGDVFEQILGALLRILMPIILISLQVDKAAADARDAASDTFASGGSGSSLVDLASSRLKAQLFVPPSASSPDDLAKEVVWLSQASELGTDALKGLEKLLGQWRSPGPAVSRLLAQVRDVMADILRGQAVQLLDLQSVRRQVESEIRRLIPSKANLTYDFSAALEAVPNSGAPIFLPDPGTQLTINTRTTIDLLGSAPPDAEVRAELGPFAIKLLGSFDVVTLMFDRATFRSRTGAGPEFNIAFNRVVLGEQAKFLEELSAYLSPPNGNGFFLSLLGRGVQAGFRLNLGTISIGTISFINVNLNAACELPFDGGEARFITGLSSPDAPFLISEVPYGGGGHLSLIANSHGIVGCDASFQWGGVAAFSYGPLEAVGRISIGVELRKEQDRTTLTGLFYAGGSAHILCFGVSASLTVRLVHDNGHMSGEATYSFSFSAGFITFDFSIDVSFGMNQQFQSSASSGSGVRFAGPGGLIGVPPSKLAPDKHTEGEAYVSHNAIPLGQNFKTYSGYFDHSATPLLPV